MQRITVEEALELGIVIPSSYEDGDILFLADAGMDLPGLAALRLRNEDDEGIGGMKR